MIVSYLTHLLRKAGVDHVYGTGEDAVREIARAVSSTSGMAWIPLRTAEAAACAATEEAAATGELAVCAGSYGAGQSDLVLGLSDAHVSGAPVLAIASPVRRAPDQDQRRQRIHPERLFAGCSSYCGILDDPSQMAPLTRAAMQHALVQADVAVLVIESFVAAEWLEEGDPFRARRGGPPALGRTKPHVRRQNSRSEACAFRRHNYGW